MVPHRTWKRSCGGGGELNEMGDGGGGLGRGPSESRYLEGL